MAATLTASMAQSRISVLLVDPHTLLRSGLSLLLESSGEFRVIGQAADAAQALRFLEREHADIILLDPDAPGLKGGIDLIRLLHASDPHSNVIVLTNLLDGAAVHDALRAGAISYLLKTISVDELLHALQAAYRGKPVLSPEVMGLLIQEISSPAELIRALTTREQEVLRLMARGWNNHQIAEELHISLSTVQYHVSNILAKLAVHNRTEATSFALRHHFELGDA